MTWWTMRDMVDHEGDVEVQEHGVRGQTRISHPPKLLALLVTVRGNSHQVGQLPMHHTPLDGQ